MRIVVTGSYGQLGSECVQLLSKTYETVGVDMDKLDITDKQSVAQFMETYQPDYIINCAAFTRVDDCEDQQEIAWAINVEGPKILAQTAESLNAILIHISTDYVFDGNKTVPEPYFETNEPNPQSYYGLTKFEGEKAVIASTDRFIILRTAWLYSIHGHNFLRTIHNLSIQKPDQLLNIVHTQFGSLTWSYDLACQIKKLIENKGNGIYHASSEGYCSWYEGAIYFLNACHLPYQKVNPCTEKEYPTRAIRPKNSILENARLKQEGINMMPHWKDAINVFVKKLQC